MKKHSVCLFDFMKITNPLKCVDKVNATIIEFANFDFIANQNPQIITELVCRIRQRQILIILQTGVSTKRYASLIAPDMVLCKADLIDQEELKYYHSTQTPMAFDVSKKNFSETMRLYGKYRFNLLVDAEIPISFLEGYDVDKENVFYKDLPLCTANDYEVHSSLTSLNTITELAVEDTVVPFNALEELSLYTKTAEECRNCKQLCFGRRKNNEVPLITINTDISFRYHSLMEDATCKNFPKVVKETLNPDDYENTWVVPFSNVMLMNRLNDNFIGEDYCYVFRPTDTMFFCRKSDYDKTFERKDGKLFWNCPFLNRNQPELLWKADYDIMFPKGSTVISLKLNSRYNYMLSEMETLRNIPNAVIRNLLSGKEGLEIEEGEDGRLSVNGKKVLGREYLLTDEGYIENICVYSSMVGEEENFKLMRNRDDFDTRIGITDLAPEITADVIHEEIYKAYSEFFREHRARFENFGKKQAEETEQIIEAAKHLNIRGDLIEVGAGKMKLFEKSRTLDCDKKNNPNICAYFSELFVRKFTDLRVTFIMCRMWNPVDFPKPDQRKTLEAIFDKGHRFIIYFAHNEYNPGFCSMWHKTDEDIRKELKGYGISDDYLVIDLSEGFFEIRRKDV